MCEKGWNAMEVDQVDSNVQYPASPPNNILHIFSGPNNSEQQPYSWVVSKAHEQKFKLTSGFPYLFFVNFKDLGLIEEFIWSSTNRSNFIAQKANKW